MTSKSDRFSYAYQCQKKKRMLDRKLKVETVHVRPVHVRPVLVRQTMTASIVHVNFSMQKRHRSGDISKKTKNRDRSCSSKQWRLFINLLVPLFYFSMLPQRDGSIYSK